MPIVRECRRKDVSLTIVNTGQHYDYEMSRVFFDKLGLPEPQFDLGVGSGTHAQQTGSVMVATETTLLKIKPDICIVPGDTNSAIGSCLASVKLKIPVAHLEAGLRSHEEFMAEEINRKVIDHSSRYLFAPTRNAVDNLEREGIPSDKITLTGDTMYDLYLSEKPLIDASELPDDRLRSGNYVLMTLHRQENTEDAIALIRALEAVTAQKINAVLPVHPRTAALIEREGLSKRIGEQSDVIMTPPLPYHQLMRTMRDASAVLTDSGGVQKEAFMSKVPCITLRPSTEWTETVSTGGNILVSEIDAELLKDTIKHVLQDRQRIINNISKAGSLFGDGKAAERSIRSLLA